MKRAGNSSISPQLRLKNVLPNASAARLRVIPAKMIQATASNTFSRKLLALLHQGIFTSDISDEKAGQRYLKFDNTWIFSNTFLNRVHPKAQSHGGMTE
jgi:hypothetical protein